MNAPRPNCPENDVLQELAAGILAPAMAEQTMLHVAECPSCGPTLRQYLREFSDEQSPENIAILKHLKSSKPEWQKKLVRQSIGGGRPFRWLKLVPATAALAAVVFGFVEGPGLLSDFKVNQAQKAVATAFVERRTTEMRLTAVDHARYNPFTVPLGSETGLSVDEIPPSLHDASSAANKNLQAKNADPRWLQIQGRALLWESTPSSLEKAEKDFANARSEGLATPSLEIDLAASYFERDSRAEHPNLQRTLNLLSEVLSKPDLSKDDQASALFNLAIAYEKTQAWDLAVDTWEKYLQVDSTSGWTNEARQRLAAAKAKSSNMHRQSYSDPGFFLQQKAQGALRPEDPEQYQQKALSQWLPVAMADKNSDAYRALSSLADILSNEHSDQWMKAFLTLMSPSETEGLQALSAAVVDNEQGLHKLAIAQSEIAEEVFRAHKNMPGQLFAEFQWIYAKRSLLLAEQCLVRANPLWEALSSTKYRWLQGQVALERAQCKNFLGELGESDSDSAISLNLAQRSHFPVLELRIFGISASMHLQQGRCDGAWEQGVEGLKRYWEGIYPRDRLDQFYAVLWQCTEESGSLYAARDVLQHTLALRRMATVHNPFREAMLHLRLRNIFLSQKQYKLAEAEDAAASSLLANLEDKTIDLTEYRLINDIEPAELQLQQGDPAMALATIKRVSNNLKTVQSDFITLNVSRVSGNIYRELGSLDQATSEYQNAINIAETTLKSLRDGDDRLKWLKATDDSYRGLVRVLLAQKKAEEALEKWEWYQSRPLLQGFHANDVPISTTESNRNQGRSSKRPVRHLGETRLVYANFKDGLQIWMSNEKGLQSTWVKVKQQDFERTVRDFSERCATPDSKLSELREEGTWLYTQLLQPIIASLPESQVVIVELDRSAYNLSMEALTSPAGWYFGEKYPVAYSPGTRMEQALRVPRSVGLDAELLLLDASHSPGSTYLPGMEAQRTLISHLFPRTHVVNSSTTRWSEIHSLLASSQIFHYIGHGRRDGSGTSLVLNAKDSLRAADIDPKFFVRSQLVVLAACSTAIGRESGLLDTNSLVRTFLIAGVPTVVASHWDVDSANTSRLMINFYENIVAEKSIVQAIYLARKQILVDRPHPYYWASFSLTGRVS
jgi:CHAT domain-containing protein